MSDPFQPGSMSCTIKQDSREGTWLVFHGTPAAIEEMILATFEGLVKGPDMDLAELILDATSLYKAGSNAHATLGARNIAKDAPAKPAPATETAGSEPAAETAPEAPAEPAPPAEPARDPILVRIDGLTDLAGHRDTWIAHKERLQAEPELMDAWKAKGAALKAA